MLHATPRDPSGVEDAVLGPDEPVAVGDRPVPNSASSTRPHRCSSIRLRAGRCDAPASRLALVRHADIMSDVKTFSVRDLDRTPAVVLAACDRDGEARIRRRDGRTYRLMPVSGSKRKMSAVPDFAARRARVFARPLTAAQARRVDEAIRGE